MFGALLGNSHSEPPAVNNCYTTSDYFLSNIHDAYPLIFLYNVLPPHLQTSHEYKCFTAKHTINEIFIDNPSVIVGDNSFVVYKTYGKVKPSRKKIPHFYYRPL